MQFLNFLASFSINLFKKVSGDYSVTITSYCHLITLHSVQVSLYFIFCATKMKQFSLQQRIDMVLVIGECYENCLLAAKVYAQKYPDREHPRKEVFERLLNRFRATGNVAYEKVTITKSITDNEDNKMEVLQSVIENPNTSTRVIANEVDISHSSVWRILKKHKYHPFHMQMHQYLYERDFDRRLEFCLWALDRLGEDSDFFKHVLFSDEATFHNNGLVNNHNFHYYDTENRHLFRTIDRQNRWSINVWGGIIDDFVIGPYFFDGCLNGQKFLRFLKRNLWLLLHHLPLSLRQNMWIQLDGAPAHYSVIVRNYLNRKFPEKWIGRGGFAEWPPRSPDLTPMDFFKWGYIKNIVYSSPPTTADDMKLRIKNAFSLITPNMLHNVRRSFDNRIRHCIEQDGQHIEHLM